MRAASLLRRARAAAPRIFGWAERRAAERSTWIGLSALAGALGYSTLGDHLTRLADIVPMVLGVAGAAIAAASTTPHGAPPPAPAVDTAPPTA